MITRTIFVESVDAALFDTCRLKISNYHWEVIAPENIFPPIGSRLIPKAWRGGNTTAKMKLVLATGKGVVREERSVIEWDK